MSGSDLNQSTSRGEINRPDAVLRATLELVLGQSLRSVFLHLVILAIALAGVKDELSWTVVAVVYGSALLWSVPRFGVAMAFRRRPEWTTLETWNRLFVVTLGGNCAIWGFGAVWMMPKLPLLEQVFLFCFVVGMTAGTALVYNVHTTASLMSVVLLITPSLVYFASEPVLLLRLLAISGTLIVVATVVVVFVQGGLIRRYFDLVQQLAISRDEAERIATTDSLTSVGNRRSFERAGLYLLEQARRTRRPLTLVLFDVDRFKEINDEHGHAVGDKALVTVTAALKSECRQVDLVARIGGDEFAVWLPDTKGSGGRIFVDRFNLRLERESESSAPKLNITCSSGAAEAGPETDLAEIMARADRALYRSKAGGRQRLTIDENRFRSYATE